MLILKKHTHTYINKQLNLYHINKNSPGMIFWHENGLIIFNNLIKLIRKKLIKYHYKEVKSPTLINKNMWIKSGHWKYYKNSMFTVITNNKKQICIKPMNCIGHIDIYKQKIRSYKDLPVRYAEFGECYRNESTGSVYGLIRTKAFTQDDAHIFCTYKEIEKEIKNCIKMTYEIYNIFNFNQIKVSISTKPIKAIGENETWIKAENILINILKKQKITYFIKKEEGAFYGPKIEFILEDTYQRLWQCGTIQLDYYLSKKLNISYVNKHNIKKYPIIIHRAILGSIERFIGILLEKTKGFLPLWLTPIQIVIINISDKHIIYSKYILNIFIKNKIRILSDFRNKFITFKIREYTLRKIPYIIICGDKENKNHNITIRKNNGTIKNGISIQKFIKHIKKKIKKGINY